MAFADESAPTFVTGKTHWNSANCEFSAVAEEGSITRAPNGCIECRRTCRRGSSSLKSSWARPFCPRASAVAVVAGGQSLAGLHPALLALHDEAEAAVQGGEPTGDFVLGTMYSTAAIHLPALLVRYHRTYPAVNCRCRPRPSGDLIEGLLSGRLTWHWSTARRTFAARRHAIVRRTPGGDRAMRLRDRSLCEVPGVSVFTFVQGCSYRIRREKWFAHDQVAMGRVMEIESIRGMLACVIAGAGVALMSESMLATLPGREMHGCTLGEPFASATTWLMWRRGRTGRSQCLDRAAASGGTHHRWSHRSTADLSDAHGSRSD